LVQGFGVKFARLLRCAGSTESVRQSKKHPLDSVPYRKFMFKRLLSVGGFTLLSRITGFIRDILMAAVLGHGALSDAFVGIAFKFPNYFRAVFGEGTLNPAFLPRYAALRAKGEMAAAGRFADQVYSWQMITQVVLLVLAMIGMPAIVGFLSADEYARDPQVLAVATNLSRITFPYLLMTVVAVQLTAMLNADDKFWAGAAWSNFLNLTMIGALLLSPWFPNAAYAAAWGVLAGGVLQWVFIIWAAARDGLRLKFRWPRWTPEMKEFFWAVGAVTVGTASITLSPFVDTYLAFWIGKGSATALYYGDRINQLPLGVLGIALGTVLLPDMSNRIAKGDVAGSDAAQNRAGALALLLALPFVLIFLAIPDTIMRAIFAHGAFDQAAAAHAAMALMAYGVGLPAMVLVRIAASTFYARHDTATPARCTVSSILSNIALKIVLVFGFGWGIAGIALGTALGAWVNVAMLVWYGRRERLLKIQPLFRRALGPIVLAAVAAGVGAWGGVTLIGWVHLSANGLNDLVSLAAAGILAAAGYGAVVLAFRRRLPITR
jgi:putative peptidoglycan lipid II flippase